MALTIQNLDAVMLDMADAGVKLSGEEKSERGLVGIVIGGRAYSENVARHC